MFRMTASECIVADWSHGDNTRLLVVDYLRDKGLKYMEIIDCVNIPIKKMVEEIPCMELTSL